MQIDVPAELSSLNGDEWNARPVCFSLFNAGIAADPEEFDGNRALLQFFMQHPGEAMSKSHILDNVWDAAYDGDLNVVEVYVRYLRLKLDAPFGRHALETIRGVGYRLDPSGG